jgi:hypothetical protein
LKNMNNSINPQVSLSSSVARVQNGTAITIDLSGENPVIKEAKLNNHRFEENGLTLVAGTDLLIGATSSDYKGYQLINGTTGETIASHAMGATGHHTDQIHQLSDGLYLALTYDRTSWGINFIKAE